MSRELQKAFGTKVRLLEDDEQKEIPLPNPKRIIAGSVYNLPFSDKSFDCVVGNRVVEHIDLAQALPEMIRVLEPDGEIRLSGVLLSASDTRRKLLQGLQEYDSRSGNYHLEPVGGIEETMKWIAAQETLSMYVLFDGLAQRSEVRRHNPYVAGVMIIRKDTNQPKAESHSKMRNGFDQKFRQLEGYPDQYPGLGKIYKVNPKGPKVTEDRPWEYYYELSET